jgi:hypothetical protein
MRLLATWLARGGVSFGLEQSDIKTCQLVNKYCDGDGDSAMHRMMPSRHSCGCGAYGGGSTPVLSSSETSATLATGCMDA